MFFFHRPQKKQYSVKNTEGFSGFRQIIFLKGNRCFSATGFRKAIFPLENYSEVQNAVTVPNFSTFPTKSSQNAVTIQKQPKNLIPADSWRLLGLQESLEIVFSFAFLGQLQHFGCLWLEILRNLGQSQHFAPQNSFPKEILLFWSLWLKNIGFP